MAEVLPVRPADLLIDEENPRILEPNKGQPDALHALAKELGTKLYTHAADIAQHGLDPSALLIVEELQGSPQRYRVLEGNRRLAALRVLENPELVSGSVTSDLLKKIRKLNKDYLKEPIDSVNCVVMNRNEARHWIELRHTGQNEGAGVVPWGSDESARYQARAGGKQIPAHLQALEFLSKRGDLSNTVRKQIAVTTFKRLIDTPSVRAKLGLSFESGLLKMLGSPDKIAKALMHVIDDLVQKRINVSDVYHAPQRDKYAAKLPSSVSVPPTVKPADAAPLMAGATSSTRSKTQPRKRVRDHLIPADCVLSIPDNRIGQIEEELRRRLSLEKHTNAIAVVFRVFVELSCDDYLTRHPIAGVNDDSKLRAKIEKVSIDLESKGRLNKQQGRAIRNANNDTSSLSPGTATFNGYVHNPHAFPAPTDLRQHWNSLQPLMAAIWT